MTKIDKSREKPKPVMARLDPRRAVQISNNLPNVANTDVKFETAIRALAYHRTGSAHDPKWTAAKTAKKMGKGSSTLTDVFDYLEDRYGAGIVGRGPSGRSSGKLLSLGELVGDYSRMVVAVDWIFRNRHDFVGREGEFDDLVHWLKQGYAVLEPLIGGGLGPEEPLDPTEEPVDLPAE